MQVLLVLTSLLPLFALNCLPSTNKYMQLLNHRAGSCFHAVIPDGLDQAGVLEHYGPGAAAGPVEPPVVVRDTCYYKAWFCNTFFMEKLYLHSG